MTTIKGLRIRCWILALLRGLWELGDLGLVGIAIKVMRACQYPALHTLWRDKGPVGIASLSNHDFHQGFRIKCPNMQSSSPGLFENSSLCKIWGALQSVLLEFRKWRVKVGPVMVMLMVAGGNPQLEVLSDSLGIPF